MAVNPDSSLERYQEILRAHNPNLAELLQAETEEQFIAATDGALERAIRTMEGARKHYSKQDEQDLSQRLADLLNHTGYQATPERNNNGHVDIVVEHLLDARWKYLGECKIYRGYQYHVDGCEQLLGYCSGRESRAFCLDFFRKPGMYEKLTHLRKQVDQKLPLDQLLKSSGHKIKGAFVSRHRHSSGCEVEILHVGCSVPKG